MDNNISKALWIGVGVLFFIAVVSIGIRLLGQSTDIANKQSNELSEIANKLSNAKYKMYDNNTVTGSQVLDAIREFKENSDIFAIRVTTNKLTKSYLNNASFSENEVTIGTACTNKAIEDSISNASTEGNQAYINPTAKFDSKLRKDKNGVISAMIFTQK